ncbi:hypothetical protein [Aeromonas hydrophila]|uniref:hypothetical protein n=1 Tax=Aeromonas hydrophila TaxID=644 RepID=UPI002B479F81|nr:hypothetical protein [Aeromonas hydrophila]
MATTTKTLSTTAWVLVSSSVSGTMENQTGQRIRFRTGNTLPAPSEMVGLTLAAGERESWSFEPAQNIYARADQHEGGLLVVVEG